MKPIVICEALLKCPELESAAIFYKEHFGHNQSNPWDEYFQNLFVEFDIELPGNFSKGDVKTLIGLTIIQSDYEIIPDSSARSYFVKGSLTRSFLHLLNDIELSSFIVNSAGLLVQDLYIAHKNKELDRFFAFLEVVVDSWNENKYVVQERVVQLHHTNTIPGIAEELGFNSGAVFQIIHDFTRRVDETRLSNLDRFMSKIENLLEQNPAIEKDVPYLRFILNEINNGGQSIKNIFDVLPQYNRIEFN